MSENNSSPSMISSPPPSPTPRVELDALPETIGVEMSNVHSQDLPVQSNNIALEPIRAENLSTENSDSFRSPPPGSNTLTASATSRHLSQEDNVEKEALLNLISNHAPELVKLLTAQLKNVEPTSTTSVSSPPIPIPLSLFPDGNPTPRHLPPSNNISSFRGNISPPIPLPVLSSPSQPSYPNSYGMNFTPGNTFLSPEHKVFGRKIENIAISEEQREVQRRREEAMSNGNPTFQNPLYLMTFEDAMNHINRDPKVAFNYFSFQCVYREAFLYTHSIDSLSSNLKPFSHALPSLRFYEHLGFIPTREAYYFEFPGGQEANTFFEPYSYIKQSISNVPANADPALKLTNNYTFDDLYDVLMVFLLRIKEHEDWSQLLPLSRYLGKSDFQPFTNENLTVGASVRGYVMGMHDKYPTMDLLMEGIGQDIPAHLSSAAVFRFLMQQVAKRWSFGLLVGLIHPMKSELGAFLRLVDSKISTYPMVKEYVRLDYRLLSDRHFKITPNIVNPTYFCFEVLDHINKTKVNRFANDMVKFSQSLEAIKPTKADTKKKHQPPPTYNLASLNTVKYQGSQKKKVDVTPPSMTTSEASQSNLFGEYYFPQDRNKFVVKYLKDRVYKGRGYRCIKCSGDHKTEQCTLTEYFCKRPTFIDIRGLPAKIQEGLAREIREYSKFWDDIKRLKKISAVVSEDYPEPSSE